MARGRDIVRAVIASAARLKITDNASPQQGKRPQWQKDAFGYYDSLGEIWYASQFYSRTLAKLMLRPERINDEGIPEPSDDPRAWAVLDRMQDPGGGREEMQSQYGKLRFLCGEMYLFCTLDPNGREVWEILSPLEITFDGREYTRKLTPDQKNPLKFRDAGDTMQLEEGTALGWRLWKKHPAYSAMADSPMRAILDECEELLILSLGIRSNARSRAAGAGILLIPDELSPAAPAKPGGGLAGGVVADENPEVDPFLDDLTRTMTTPIGDEGSAAAVVPMVVRGMGEALDKVRHLPLSRPDDRRQNAAERRECIERMALGIDMPPEVLLGVTDANHWTAWQIDESSWKAHVEPVADDMVGDFTAAYFQPSLEAMGVADWDRFIVGYDESNVVRRPDKSGDAIRLFDRMELKGETLRTEAGFTEDDKPDEAEIQERIDRAAAMGQGSIQQVPKNDAPVPRGDTKPGKGTPEENAAKIAAAVDLMVDRCRSLAGSRIRTKLQRLPDYANLVRYVPNDQVAATLRVNLGTLPQQVGPPDVLVAGGAEIFAERLAKWGLPPDVVTNLVRAAEEHARDTLLDPDPGVILGDELSKLIAIAEMGVT